MSRELPGSRFRNNAAGIAAIVVTGTWLAALVLDYDWWLAALLFGYIVIVPVVGILFGAEEDDDPSSDSEEDRTERAKEAPDRNETPLEILRRRYASGELTDEEFEHKLELLLETETIEDVAARSGRTRLQERES